MSASLEIRGLEELKQALRNLPAALKGASTAIVLDSAHAAKADIVAQYPEKTGKLRKGVKVDVQELGPHGVAARVRSAAPHGWLYEHGTQARHTSLGWRRGRMPAPPTPVFIPTMIRHRRQMFAKLARLIQEQGLEVKSGE